MKDFSDVVKLFLREKEIYNLSITGVDAMAKMNISYDDIFDSAHDSFYPIDSFTIEAAPQVIKKLTGRIIVDETMWYKNSIDEEPIHENNGLEKIYDDCKVALVSSGMTLQEENFSFVDLVEIVKDLSNYGIVKMTIPYVIEDFYEMTYDKGRVKKMSVDLSNVSRKEGLLALYQALILANNRSIEEVLDLID